MKRYISSTTYTYRGYATDYFGNSLGWFRLTTEAPTKEKAKTNFQYQIRLLSEMSLNSVVNMDEGLIRKIHSIQPAYHTSDDKPVDSPKILTCPNCGSRLSDGGYCPRCDDGFEEGD